MIDSAVFTWRIAHLVLLWHYMVVVVIWRVSSRHRPRKNGDNKREYVVYAIAYVCI